MRTAKTRHIKEGIDHAGRRCSGGADYHQWPKTVPPVLRHLSLETREIHLQIAVRRDGSQRISTQPRYVCDLVERVMGLRGEVDGGRRGEATYAFVSVVRESPRQGHNHRREIRLCSSASKGRSSIAGQAELARQPPENMALHLVGRRR